MIVSTRSIVEKENCEASHLLIHHDSTFQIEVEDKENSLSTLNEDCLLQIFNELDLMELCRMVDVCKTFKKIAMLSFSSRFKFLRYPKSLHYPDEKSQMRRVLCKFGHLIESLYVVDLLPPAELNVISKYCTGTLKALYLELYVPLICGQVQPLFGSLETLSLQYRNSKGNAQALFKDCPKLKVLEVRYIAFTYHTLPEFVQSYPNLESIIFLVDSDEIISSLLRLNLQIKRLEMLGYHADKTICGVASKMDHLEHLILRGFSSVNSMKGLSELKSLKVLELSEASQIDSVVDVMKDYPLDCLKLDIIDLSFRSDFKMKFLRKLELYAIQIPFEKLFTNLDEQFPSLEELELWFSHSQNLQLFTIDDIKSLIGSSKTLSLLAIDTKQAIDYDQGAYDSLLETVRKRSDAKMLTITICSKNAEREPIVSDQLRMKFTSNCCNEACCRPFKSIRLTNREGYIHMIRMFGTHPPGCACGTANINTGTSFQRIVKMFVSFDLQTWLKVAAVFVTVVMLIIKLIYVLLKK